jgi:GNAT superfamily N-acetyltransferase
MTIAYTTNDTFHLLPRLQIRHLAQHDEADLLDLLLGLDASSRTSRFSGTMKDTSLKQYARGAISSATLVAGAYIDGRLRGAVEIYDNPCGGFAEAAFVVHQDWRRQGIGFALLQIAQQWCKESRRPTMRLVFARCNLPMRKLASKAAAQIDLVMDEIVADVAIGPPGMNGTDPLAALGCA